MSRRVLHVRVSGAKLTKCGVKPYQSAHKPHRVEFRNDEDADSVPMCRTCAALSPNARSEARRLSAKHR